jgi:cytidylate kinase
MYRAVTLKALQEQVDPTDAAALARVAEAADIACVRKNGVEHVLLDGVDVTEDIRSMRVTRHVSAISEVGLVREAMVVRQRKMGESGGIVVEGRDIGTVVFPDADIKVFMVADVGERARRRSDELRDQTVGMNSQQIKQDICRRDRHDCSRAHSPLRCAEDAQVIDTTNLTIHEQVQMVIDRVDRFLREHRKEDVP